jgi:uncharacterized protein
MTWPIPAINDDNCAFWTGGRDRRLMIATCDDCGYRTHPPGPRCPRCYADRVTPRAVSGRGSVYSFTVNRRAWSPGLEVPYVIAVVELPEQAGLRLLTNIVGVAPGDVAIGMPVEVEFAERGGAFLPVFRRAA